MELDVEHWYREYGHLVHRRCLSLLGDEDEAFAAMQDVFVKLLEMGDPDVRNPSTLLYVMATRHCLNLIRSRKRRPDYPNSEMISRVASLENPLGQSRAGMLLSWLFGRNPDSSRVIAVLHFVDGLTLAETAREVGMSVSGVRRRIRVMREQLRELEEAT